MGKEKKTKTWQCKLYHLEVTIFLHFRSCLFNLIQPKANRRKVIPPCSCTREIFSQLTDLLSNLTVTTPSRTTLSASSSNITECIDWKLVRWSSSCSGVKLGRAQQQEKGTSKDGDSTVWLGNLCQWFDNHHSWVFLLMVTWNFLYFHLFPLPLVIVFSFPPPRKLTPN